MTALRIAACPSPNFGERRAEAVDILLLHYTGMADDAQALAWLCNPESQVSSHYFVHRDGRVLALVPEEKRAWHAGASRFCGESDVNSRSIGVEIANAGHPGGLPPYPDAQIDALIALCADILARHPIPPNRVLAHSDVAPGRKLDPGERFPWARLAAAGVGHCVEPAPLRSGSVIGPGAKGGAVAALQGMLALYGYGVAVTGSYDVQTEAVVAAFQRHFRSARVDGVADASTRETLAALIHALD
jgi:N-acetylmuramoyl-L-alanine amidase